MQVRVERMSSGGFWPWKASVYIERELFLEIGRTRAGALRRLRRTIKKAMKFAMRPEAKPWVEMVELEID